MKLIAGILENDGNLLVVQSLKPYEPEYEWFFPMTQEEENKSPKMLVKEYFKDKFNLEVDITGDMIDFVPGTGPEVIILYPLKISGGTLKSSDEFRIVKWIKSKEIPKYFSARLSYKLSKFLRSIEG